MDTIGNIVVYSCYHVLSVGLYDKEGCGQTRSSLSRSQRNVVICS